MADRHAWRSQAACSGADPDLFFAKGSASDVSKALAYCADCPVRQACLDDALRVGDEYGIRGGLNPHQRSQIAGPKPIGRPRGDVRRNYADAIRAKAADGQTYADIANTFGTTERTVRRIVAEGRTA